MKRFYLPIISSSIITVSFALLPLNIPAKAQISNDETSDTTSRTYRQDVENYREDRGFNWSWLGLLGLAGLTGLNRPREEETYIESNNSHVTTQKTVGYTEPNEHNSHVTTENAVRYRDPSEVDNSVNTEKAVRYIDPSEIRLPDTDGKSDRYQ